MQEFNQEEFERTWAADYVSAPTFKDYLKDIAKAFANTPHIEFEFFMNAVAFTLWTAVWMFFYCIFGGY